MRTTPTERVFLKALKNVASLVDAHYSGCSADSCSYCLALRHVLLAISAAALDDGAALVSQAPGAAPELEKLNHAVRDLIRQKGLD